MQIKMIADILHALFCSHQAPKILTVSSNKFLSDSQYDESLSRASRTTGDSIIVGGGVSHSINEADMKILIKKLFGENNENKLLHIIERFSLMGNLVGKVSYGRLVADLLSFCFSVRGEKIVIRN